MASAVISDTICVPASRTFLLSREVLMQFLCGCLIASVGFAAAAPAAPQADDAAGMQIVTKAIKAAGGDKVAKLKAGTVKGKLAFQEGGQDIAITLDVSWQGLTQFRMDAEAQVAGMTKNGTIIINGDKGWIKDEGKVKDIPNEIATILRETTYAVRMPHLLPELKTKDFKTSVLGEMKIGDRDAIGVTISHKDRKEVTLYFDKENGLPLRSDVRVMDPGGRELEMQFAYRDYKEMDGLKHCTRLGIRVDGKDYTMELSELRPQGTLDASVFAEPK
jgi:hypothetical protein